MHIVYIHPRTNRTARGIYDPSSERMQNDVVGECKRTQKRVDEHEQEADTTYEIGTFLFKGKGSAVLAKQAAERLAKQHPGDDVYVSAVSTVVAATIPNVIYKTVTEKGILPA